MDYIELYKDLSGRKHYQSVEEVQKDLEKLKPICEKATPQKYKEKVLYCCPSCGTKVNGLVDSYCWNCGQALAR